MSLKFPFARPAAALALSVVVIGFLLFGRDFLSYMRTSGRIVQSAAREQVSVEFELQRARDLVDEILPKMQGNVRLIAQDEVEIAALEKDIEISRQRLNDQRDELAGLRQQFNVQQVAYHVRGRELSREHLAQQLAQQFDRYREAEQILESKQALLTARCKSLQAAMQMLDQAKHQKMQLEQKIEHLIAKHRLVHANAALEGEPIDGVDLSRAEKLLAQIQTRIDVSERVLAHSSELRPTDLHATEVKESEVLSEFDDYFGGQDESLASVLRE